MIRIESSRYCHNVFLKQHHKFGSCKLLPDMLGARIPLNQHQDIALMRKMRERWW